MIYLKKSDYMEEALELLEYLETFLTEERKQRFIEILESRTKHFTIAVEDVYQKHNTSALIRSCDIFGIQEAHLIELRNESQLDKNIAMGAEQWVDTYRYPSTATCIEALKKQGYQIIATTPNENSCLLADFDVSLKSAFFFGTEREGLSDEVMQKADSFLKIQMIGFTQSLNVSVSAAIILHDISNKLRESDLNWKLTEIEIIKKRLDWSKKSIQSIEGILQRYHNN